MARRAAEVVGVEGDAPMVQRGWESAERNGILNTRHFVGNLFEPDPKQEWMQQKYDKILLDPPRAEPWKSCTFLAKMKPKRIVYVSCNPATLARDAGILVNEQRYRLVSAGVMDMFPHTSHVESIAVFEQNRLSCCGDGQSDTQQQSMRECRNDCQTDGTRQMFRAVGELH